MAIISYLIYEAPIDEAVRGLLRVDEDYTAAIEAALDGCGCGWTVEDLFKVAVENARAKAMH